MPAGVDRGIARTQGVRRGSADDREDVVFLDDLVFDAVGLVGAAGVLAVDHLVADLLVLAGDPLDDIRNVAVDKMEIIMKEGAFVKGA